MNSFTKVAFCLLMISLFISIAGCGDKLPEDKSIGNKSYNLVNQDSSAVNFPDDFKGKIVVMSFMYTNCPDICPLTTNNMQEIQEQLKKDGVKNVQFAEVTFDPDRDTPSILKKYGDVRGIDYNNFEFLTGNKPVIDTLLHHMDVFAIPQDTTYADNGTPIYFFTHTDRITLLDQNGKIRNEYRGSKVNEDNIIKDIKSLED
jgi:protein SCO1